ncbi:ribonuclease III domain-containing protein, partial [Rhodopseudomonas sp. BAL398]|uniref:ribonuclease III domain-containing protein n=1 Tax=Rhodopseudomonas sp. BAL398 TaxID=3034676 RepID=UPI0023E0DEF1
MTKDASSIDNPQTADEPAAQPAAADAPAVAKKRRSKVSAKAATAALEQRIGYAFADPVLLTTAFTHVSALKSSRSRADSYQRLEFLGDHVLGLVVSDMLYRAFPKADEGELSKRLAELVRKETCADVAASLDLLDGIKLGSVGAGARARLRKTVVGAKCEAGIGAVYNQGGNPAAAQIV